MKGRYIIAILAMAVTGFAASAALADGYYQHVTTTTTSSVQTLCVDNPGGIQQGDVVLGYYASNHCTGNNIGNGNDHSAHYANVNRTVESVQTITTCDNNPDGAASGPYIDDSCTTLADGGTTDGGTTDGGTTDGGTTDGGTTDGGTTTTSGNHAPAAAPPTPAGIFLCYSTDQLEPGVWPATQAADLVAAGYWQPYAVNGNVEGGTNLGGYHLVCNIASGQAVGDQFVDDGGETSNAADHSALASVLGQYPLVSG